MQRWFFLCACFLLTSCGQESEAPASSPVENAGEAAAPAAVDHAGERAELAAGSTLPQPVTSPDLLSCEPMDGMTAHCGYQNPEDLVQIPGTELLIVSEMGEFMADTPGDLSLLNMTTGGRETLSIDWAPGGAVWGDTGCPAPDTAAFSPHGIDLVIRDDGAAALLVVNHGGREAVEFFEVAPSGSLAWRGCALPPGDPFINDVAARRDGGFYVTHMWDKSTGFEETVAALLGGEPTGWVWAWAPTEGFSKLPNSDDLMPNGIAINGDNTMLFVNVYMGNKAFSMDLSNNSRVNEVELQQPDNVTVDAEGSLWIASHRHDPIGQACTQVTAGPCLLPFQVLKADPASLEAEVIIDHDGPPAGYVTVALMAGNRLYLGTAHGDRVVSVEL